MNEVTLEDKFLWIKREYDEENRECFCGEKSDDVDSIDCFRKEKFCAEDQ
jgi:hypothetical protein